MPLQSTHAVKIAFDQFSIFIAVHRNSDAGQLDRAQAQTARGDPVAPPRRRPAPLLKWRLNRVVAYVDAHLGGRITLPGMAAAAGLTPMHFAAQFRSATGLRPHDYVLQRRIDRARELLRDPGRALVDVALSVGFQTQAHFTTVFKRFAGAPPHSWRRLMSAGTEANRQT
jgi:transcriptional regulator GlxA family with amidase domain